MNVKIENLPEKESGSLLEISLNSLDLVAKTLHFIAYFRKDWMFDSNPLKKFKKQIHLRFTQILSLTKVCSYYDWLDKKNHLFQKEKICLANKVV